MSALGIPIDIEKSEISSCLNSFILSVFVMGMYTVIYFGAMYIHLMRNSFKRPTVPAIITMIFLCNTIETGVQWYATKWQFVNNGDTRDSVFASLWEAPRWFYLAVYIPYYVSFLLADGLLIWRCFYVWNRSFRIIAVPCLLTITEAALFLVDTVFQAIYSNTIVSAALAARDDRLLSASYFTTFVTSLGTTALIAYRIYSTWKEEGVPQRFRRVIDIVVQSGAVYSLSMLVIAISEVVQETTNLLDTREIALIFYTSLLTNIIAGISVTIMFARISMLVTDTTYPTTSLIQFRAHSTHQMTHSEDMEMAHSIKINGDSVGEGQQIEIKV